MHCNRQDAASTSSFYKWICSIGFIFSTDPFLFLFYLFPCHISFLPTFPLLFAHFPLLLFLSLSFLSLRLLFLFSFSLSSSPPSFNIPQFHYDFPSPHVLYFLPPPPFFVSLLLTFIFLIPYSIFLFLNSISFPLTFICLSCLNISSPLFIYLLLPSRFSFILSPLALYISTVFLVTVCVCTSAIKLSTISCVTVTATARARQ